MDNARAPRCVDSELAEQAAEEAVDQLRNLRRESGEQLVNDSVQHFREIESFEHGNSSESVLEFLFSFYFFSRCAPSNFCAHYAVPAGLLREKKM